MVLEDRNVSQIKATDVDMTYAISFGGRLRKLPQNPTVRGSRLATVLAPIYRVRFSKLSVLKKKKIKKAGPQSSGVRAILVAA